MNTNDDSKLRQEISDTFAQWAAFSGTRSGCPLKARTDLYPLIKLPNYDIILKGNIAITKVEFNNWHRDNSILIHNTSQIMPIGWTTKLINLYLKTMVYVGQFGRPNLIHYIHPPIDNGLWKGIWTRYYKDKTIVDKTHYKTRIKDIKTYEDYQCIIDGIELISQREGWLTIEVEKLWTGTEF